MTRMLWSALCLLWAAVAAHSKLTWGTTKFLFTFGDSYTTDGFNISAGVNSPEPGFVRVWDPANDRIAGPTYLGRARRPRQMGQIGFSSSVSAIIHQFYYVGHMLNI